MNNPYSAPTAIIEEFSPNENAQTYQPKFFAWNGRINRLRYWAYYTGALAIGVAMTITLIFLIPITRERIMHNMPLGKVNEYLLLIPIIAANVIMVRRRLQDLELSPWFMVITLIPYIGRIFSLVLSFKKGTEGRNEYGPAPAPNTIGVWVGALTVPTLIVLAIVVYAMFKTQLQEYL